MQELAAGEQVALWFRKIELLNLIGNVAPLIGLAGTVWGMIQAFFATANLPTGANKAEYLAKGIYVALVTTFAGLAVLAPAAMPALAAALPAVVRSTNHGLRFSASGSISRSRLRSSSVLS